MPQLLPPRTVCLSLVLKMWCFFPTVSVFLCWTFILVLIAPLSVTAFKHSKSGFLPSGIVVTVFTSFSTLGETVPVVNWSAHSTFPTNLSYTRKIWKPYLRFDLFKSVQPVPTSIVFLWKRLLNPLPQMIPPPQYLSSYFKLMLQVLNYLLGYGQSS